MTVLEAMKERALAEFDQMVAAREEELRHAMARAGHSKPEIDSALSACREGLAEQRAGTGRLVAVELMKVGVPLQEEIHNVRS